VSRLALYFNTVRYLRPVQIAGRIWYRARRPTPDLKPAPPLRPMAARFAPPIAPAPSLIDRNRFRFLNVERTCANEADWNAPDVPRLWTYNLHYFDDLSASASSDRKDWHVEWLQRWVEQNSPARGPGWEPYPTSRRIVNWVKWAARGNTLSPHCVTSLAIQTRWLCRRLEYHILGNHLLANAKALVFAGLYFDGPEAQEWLSRGTRILARELREQILADGAHFERSPQYHSLVLEDVFDLINAAQAWQVPVPADWLRVVPGMQRWLEAMSHPDGGISFFNDSALDIAPSAADLRSYANRIGLSPEMTPLSDVEVMSASGYVRALSGRADLICDCGDVGPDYLPGHAHADTLSFELSIGAQRVLVNSGTSEYGTGAERQRQRGSAAHNTVVIDGADSSEVWAGFRVARRARATLHAVKTEPRPFIDASHDGYRRLRGRNVHRRCWQLAPDALRIEDSIEGSFAAADAYFHVHPEVRAEQSGAFAVTLAHPSLKAARMTFEGAASVTVHAGTWHPVFGAAVPNRHIVVRFGGPKMVSRIDWGSPQ
jgi:uncharacterized heparinase superfamily protein